MRSIYEFMANEKELEAWSLPPNFEHFDIEVIENFWREAKDRVRSIEDIKKHVVNKATILFTFAIPLASLLTTQDRLRILMNDGTKTCLLLIPIIVFLLFFYRIVKIYRRDIFPINGINPKHLANKTETMFDVFSDPKAGQKARKLLLIHQIDLYCAKINEQMTVLEDMNRSFGWAIALFFGGVFSFLVIAY